MAEPGGGDPAGSLRAMDTDPLPAPPRIRWGIADAVAGFLAGNTLVLVAIGVWTAVSGERGLTLGTITAGQIGLWLGLAGAPVVAARVRGSGSLRSDFGLDVRWRDAGLGVPVGVVCQLVVVPLLYLPFRSLFDTDELDRPARELIDRAHGAGVWLLAAVLVVGAPVVEELFFRGLLMRALSRRFGQGWGLWGAAVAFGVAHFELLQFPALVLVGAAFGWLARRAGRLGPAIWAHGAFNAVVVAILVLER